MRVTWLLPTKNGMPFLPETLASIQAQTYQDAEVLAWDNGSTDGSIDVLRAWIPALIPGRVVTDRPLTLGLCRAEMVREVQTPLCACIDADDVSHLERLQREVSFLADHPEVAVVGSQVNLVDEQGKNLGPCNHRPERHEDILRDMLRDNPIAQPSVLFRRSAVLRAGNYCDVGPINVEDYDLWLRVAHQNKLANLSEELLNYRVHARSTTQIALAENRLRNAADQCILRHGPRLFGRPADELKRLLERRHPFSLLSWWRIALYLHQTQGFLLRETLCSPFFIDAGRHMTAPGDLVSRLALDLLDRRQSGRNIVRQIAARLIAPVSSA